MFWSQSLRMFAIKSPSSTFNSNWSFAIVLEICPGVNLPATMFWIAVASPEMLSATYALTSSSFPSFVRRWMRSLVPSIYPISSFGSSPLVIEFRNTDIASRTLVFPLPFFPVNIICLHLFSQTGISKFFKWRTLLILIFFIRKPRGQGRRLFYWVHWLN